MKYIQYLSLAIAATVLLPSCADEGPEVIASVPECSAEVVSTTPTSATVRITAADPDNIYNIHAVNSLNPDEYSYGEPVDGLPNTYIFKYLQPSTTYNISVEYRMNGGESEYYENDYSMIILAPKGQSSFTTKAEGDYSDITACTTEFIGITNTSASFLVEFVNQNLMVDNKAESIRVKYGTTPDLTGDDTREIVYEDYYDYNNFVTGGAINNLERSIAVSLINLKENTKYYFSVTGNFRYSFSSYYDEELIENVPLRIDNNSFTTTSGEQSLGKFNAYAYNTYSTSTRLEISCPESVNFAPASVGYNIDFVCSTSPDFSNAQTFSSPYENNYINRSCDIVLNGLTPGTTYYYYIIASFATETKSALVIYQNVKMEGADGCGTFTTDSQYY